MDRIYTSCDEYFNHFTKWSDDNGYIRKVNQNWSSTVTWTDGKSNFEKRFDVKLGEYHFDMYPYLDTFKWLDVDAGTISNYQPQSFIGESRNTSKRVLSIPGGRYEHSMYLLFDDIERKYSYQGELVQFGDIWTSTSNCYYSETLEKYILKSEGVYSDELEDYIYINDELNPETLVIKRMDYMDRRRARHKPPTALFSYDYRMFGEVRLREEIRRQYRDVEEQPQF
jgi:hypothetical protein